MAFNIFAMPSSAIVLLLSAAFGITDAKPWPGPAATATYKVDEWSPRPTKTAVDARALFKRDSVDVAVCGWAGGIESNAQICPSGSSCIHDTTHGAIGCCATDPSIPCTAGVYTACVDKNSKGGNTGPVVENNGIFTCPQDSLCYKNSYPDNYYQWGCGSSDQATTVETSFSGQPSDLSLQIVYTGITFTPTTITSTASSISSSRTDSSSSSSVSTSSSSSSTGSNGQQIAPTQSSGSSSDSSSTSEKGAATSTDSAAGNPKSKSSSSNPGVIAAGVVGVSAFVIALAGIILFFLRRRRAQQNYEGSFVSNLKGDGASSTPGSTQGNFSRLPPGPYGPDDFVSPLPTADSTRSQGYEQARGFDGQAQAYEGQSHGYEGQAHAYDRQAHEFDGQGDGYDGQAHAREAEAYEPHGYEAQPYEAQPYDSPYVPPVQYPVRDNGLHPVAATPPDPNMFSPTPYQEIRARAAENAVIPVPSSYYGSPPQLNTDGLPSITEFDNFSTSFHQAIAQISPPTPPQVPQMPHLGPAPTSAPSYPGIGANMAGGIGASVIAGIKNSRNLTRAPTNAAGHYSPIAGYPEDTPPTAYPYPGLDDDDDPEDDLDDDLDDEAAAEMKEMGMAQVLPQPPSQSAQLPGYSAQAPEYTAASENVRQEGWQPVELRPNREQVERLSEETRRYQLVDRPPTAAKVLHAAGQRGKGQRDVAKSKDVSKGELEE